MCLVSSIYYVNPDLYIIDILKNNRKLVFISINPCAVRINSCSLCHIYLVDSQVIRTYPI